MKNRIKLIIGTIGICTFFINTITLIDLSSKGGNLLSLKTSFARSESSDDERNITEACVKPCPGGGSAGGNLTFCSTGYIDCTPHDCDAKCGTEV